jgi:peptidoglycan/LPS O-acetylase OafA/YrhL
VQFYWDALGAGWAFFGGSLVYFGAQKLKLCGWGWAIFAAGALSYGLIMYGFPHTQPVSAYAGPVPHLALLASAGAASVMIFGLASADQTSLRFLGAAFAGKLSYPVFLLHIAAAVPIVALIGNVDKFLVWSIALPATLLCSVIVVLVIETPVDALRRQVRKWRMSGVPSASVLRPAQAPAA